MSLPPDKTSLYMLSDNGLKVNLYVQPGSSSLGFAGLLGERLKIRLTAKATDNEANQQLIGFLTRTFCLPKSRLKITGGIKSRNKTIFIEGNQKELLALLKSIIESASS